MISIYLGLGSNQNHHENIRSGLTALKTLFGDITLSPVYESKSIGFNGTNFFNLVIKTSTTLGIAELSCVLKKIEDDHGRIRNGSKFSPRSLDIDILLYGNFVGVEASVQLPRSEITENAFVLLPLSQIAPDEAHPILKKTYSQLWQAYDKNSQSLWEVELN